MKTKPRRVADPRVAAVTATATQGVAELSPGIRALKAVDAYFQEKGEEGRMTIRDLERLADVPYGTARRALLRFINAEALVLKPGHGRDPDVFSLPELDD